MKINIFEHPWAFGFDLEAETLAEAAWITRFQVNVKKDVPAFSASALKDGTFRQYISFQRKKDQTSIIKR